MSIEDRHYCLKGKDLLTLFESSNTDKIYTNDITSSKLVEYYALFLKQCYPNLNGVSVSYQYDENTIISNISFKVSLDLYILV